MESASELVPDGDGRNPIVEMPASLAAPGIYEWYHDPEQAEGVAPDVRTLERKLKEVYKETSQQAWLGDEGSLSPDSGSKENISEPSTSTRDAQTPRGAPGYMRPTVVSIAKRKSFQRRLKEYGRKGRAGQGEGWGSFDGTSERSELRSIANSALDSQEFMSAAAIADNSILAKETPRELGEWKAQERCDKNEAALCQGQPPGAQEGGPRDATNIVANSGCGRTPFAKGMNCLHQSGNKKVLCLPTLRTLKGKDKVTKDNMSEENQEGNESLGMREVSFKIHSQQALQHYHSAILDKQLPQSFDDNDSEGKPNAAIGPLVGEKDAASFGSEFPGSPVSSPSEVFETPNSNQKPRRHSRKRSRLANLVCCMVPKVAE